MHYIWWVPAAILYNIIYAWLSWKNNHFGGSYIAGLFIWNALTLWLVISRISNHLIFDALIYDFIIITVTACTLICLGESRGFTPLNYIGMGAAVMGLLMMKL